MLPTLLFVSADTPNDCMSLFLSGLPNIYITKRENKSMGVHNHSAARSKSKRCSIGQPITIRKKLPDTAVAVVKDTLRSEAKVVSSVSMTKPSSFATKRGKDKGKKRKSNSLQWSEKKKVGEPGHRSQCLSHAKRALYHLS